MSTALTGRISRALRVGPARLSTEGRRGIAGLGWSGLGQAIGLVIRLASNILLARLLAPEAYGIFGTAMAVVTTLEWLADLGIQPALVRHPKGDEASYLQTGWWLGLSRGAAITLGVVVCAMPISAFVRQPVLAGVLVGLSVRPLLLALRSPGLPLLHRSMNYRAVCIDEVAQTFVGTVVSLLLAWATGSLWSIVAGTLAGAVTSLAVSYVLCPIRPRRTWDPEAAREIGSLSRQVLVNTMVMAAWLNMDRVLGLRFVSLEAMGFYAVAWNLASVLEGLLTRGCGVYFSMLCRKGEGEARSAWHSRMLSRAARDLIPLGAVGVVLAPLAVRVLYDARYQAAGVLFGILIARLMVRAIGQVEFQMLLAAARVNLATRAYVVALVVQAVLFVALVPRFGALGLALAGLGSTTAFTAFQSWQIQRWTGGGMGPMVRTLAWTTAALAGLAFAA